MKIDEITLLNFRSASKVRFEFSPTVNLFVGVNGAGKSTILDALSIALSWLVKRIERENGRGSYIAPSSLHNDETESALDICLTENDQTYRWFLSKVAKGTQSDLTVQLTGVTRLAEVIKQGYAVDNTLPVIAYYSVNRVVTTTRPENPTRDVTGNWDIYANALGGKTNYQSFFDWFRQQDDILNENATSRTRWMRQNQSWIRSRVKRVFGYLQDAVSVYHQSIDAPDFVALIQKVQANEIIYTEPRFLFLELSDLIETLDINTAEDKVYGDILKSLVFMFYKMSALSFEHNDELISQGTAVTTIIEKTISQFADIAAQDNVEIKLHTFCWEVFSFAIGLSLWWLSDKGKQALESEFKRNSKQITTNLLQYTQNIIDSEMRQKQDGYRHEVQQLPVVTKAIEQFIPEYNFLRVKRVPRPHMLINKNGVTYNLDQLSDGEKNLIALVGDIARRLAIGNPNSEEPLKGKGFVLIDEIDLHLHPGWQRLVIPKLLEVFPGCQFFISTHSPQVISHVKPDNIFLLNQTDGSLDYVKAIESYGKNTDRILEDLLGVSARPAEEKEKLHQLFSLIQNGELAEATELVNSLSALIGDDADLVKANVLIKRKELIGK